MSKLMFVSIKGLFFQDQKVLLVWDVSEQFWDLPGGRMEAGESIETALKRELSEELLGISQVSIGNLLDVRKKEKQLSDGNELFLVYYQVNANLPEPLQLSDEHDKYQWFTRPEIEQLPEPIRSVYLHLFDKLVEVEAQDLDQQLMDKFYDQAKVLIKQTDRPTISYLQRKLWIDLSRAQKLMKKLKENGEVA